MKKTLLLASCLIGLNLVAVAGEEARSFNRSNDLSVKTETLSEVITSLIRKDAQVKSASAASLTISILEDFQNKGIGEKILKEAEKHCRILKIQNIWMNARVKAVNFYLNLNYIDLGFRYEIKGIGLHYFLYKELQ